MELIKNNDTVLLVWDQSFDPSTIDIETIKREKNATVQFENAARLIGDIGKIYKNI